ncbi:hypothetical protein L916_10546, partial [Phytophthora nicotianae]
MMDVDPSVEVRLIQWSWIIHDLSFPICDSSNDASDKVSFPNAHYTNVAVIARRIDECWELQPGVRVCIMKGDVKGAFRHLMLLRHLAEPFRGLALFRYEWVDDHVLVEADTPGRLSAVSAALRLTVMAVLGPRSINKKKFSEWSTTAEALGLEFDTDKRTLSMPATKILKAQTRVNALEHGKDVRRHELVCSLGSLRHVSTCLRMFWREPHPDLHLYMDASDEGLAVLDPAHKRYLQIRFDDEERHDITSAPDANGFTATSENSSALPWRLLCGIPLPQDVPYLYKTFSLIYRPTHWPNQVTTSMLPHRSNGVDGAPAP